MLTLLQGFILIAIDIQFSIDSYSEIVFFKKKLDQILQLQSI